MPPLHTHTTTTPHSSRPTRTHRLFVAVGVSLAEHPIVPMLMHDEALQTLILLPSQRIRRATGRAAQVGVGARQQHGGHARGAALVVHDLAVRTLARLVVRCRWRGDRPPGRLLKVLNFRIPRHHTILNDELRTLSLSDLAYTCPFSSQNDRYIVRRYNQQEKFDLS